MGVSASAPADQPPVLAKYLAGRGVASRRKAAILIADGRVAVNGETAVDPGRRIAPADHVTVDGRELEPPPPKVYIMLNKPRGYVCSNADIHAGKLAVDLIRLDPPRRLFSAGRLDKESEGLIIFSDDGDFVKQLTHPGGKVHKRYYVETSRELPRGAAERFRRGIADDGERLRALEVRKIGPARYLFTLGEGKKREVRRLVASTGAETLVLRRMAVGSLELGDLPCGKFRMMSPAERRAALGKPDTPVRKRKS